MERKAVTYEVTFKARPTITVHLPADFDLSNEEAVKEDIFETLYTDLYDYIQPYDLDIEPVKEERYVDDWD